MVANFNFLRENYFSAGGNLRKLGVSRSYIDDVLSNGVLPPSNALVFKLKNLYNIPDKFFLGDFKFFVSDRSSNPSDVIQPLLFASERLSFNSGFVDDLSRFFGDEKLDLKDEGVEFQIRNLSDIISKNYRSLGVNSRLPNLLGVFSNYFSVISSDLNQDSRLEFDFLKSNMEFNYSDSVLNPFVCLNHESVRAEDVVRVVRRDSGNSYYVKDEFISNTNIRAVWTDDSLWKLLHPRDSYRRTPNKGDDFNKVIVEYKKPIPLDVLDKLRREVSFSFKNKDFNPDFFLLSKKGGRELFQEKYVMSMPSIAGKTSLQVRYRPVMSQEADNAVGFYFYPQEGESHAVSSGAANRYFIGPSASLLASRFQNYLEKRVKIF